MHVLPLPPKQAVLFPNDSHMYVLEVEDESRQWPLLTASVAVVAFEKHVKPCLPPHEEHSSVEDSACGR
eukprot:6912397-Prymnesium_polylepis.2